MTELVSIIVPVYNRPDLLREAVTSAIAQTYRPIEIIIVDDGSTDDTPAAIVELQMKHPEVRSVRRPNGGPGLARESGRQTASGSFLQYLDSDDLLLPLKLQLQVAALKKDGAAGVAYGMTRYRDAKGAEIPCTWKPLLSGERTILPHFLLGRLWETVTPLYRVAVASEAGPWSSLRLEEDWEYDCRLGALGVELVFVPEVLAEHLDAAPDRLSRGAALDASRLVHRARAHAAIYEHAVRAGIGFDTAEMQHFARELFLLARQSGAAGLSDESRTLFELARKASGVRHRRLQFVVYRAAARLLGWSLAGKLACLSDRFRR